MMLVGRLYSIIIFLYKYKKGFKMSIKAFFFDVYGTLITFDKYYSPYSYLIKDLSLDLSEKRLILRKAMTENIPTIYDFAKKIEKEYSCIIPEDIIALSEQKLRTHLDSYKLKEDALEVLSHIKSQNYPISLISNLATPYVKPIQDSSILDFIDFTFYSFEVGFVKPGKEIFEMALQKNNVSPSEAIMIGDSILDDVTGTENIGMHALHLSPETSEENNSIASLSEVLSVLETVFMMYESIRNSSIYYKEKGMKIGMETWGSTGDIRPFISLACGLAKAGHEVQVAVVSVDDRDYSHLVKDYGIRYINIIDKINVELADIRHKFMKTHNPVKQFDLVLSNYYFPFVREINEVAQQLCAESDYLIGNQMMYPLKANAAKQGKNLPV